MKTSKYVKKYGNYMVDLESRPRTVKTIFNRLLDEAKEEIIENNQYLPSQVVYVFEKKNKKWNKIVESMECLTDNMIGVERDMFIKYVRESNPKLFEYGDILRDIENAIANGQDPSEVVPLEELHVTPPTDAEPVIDDTETTEE